MNRFVGILLILLLIIIAFASVLGYAFETKTPITTTLTDSSGGTTLTVLNVATVENNKTTTVTLTNPISSVTITEEIIGVVTPQTATLEIIVSPASPSCTILIPHFVVPILGYNTTEFILPSGNLNPTFSVVSTITTFSQMPSPQTAYTTITESGNIEVNTTITSANSTITTSTCPVHA